MAVEVVQVEGKVEKGAVVMETGKKVEAGEIGEHRVASSVENLVEERLVVTVDNAEALTVMKVASKVVSMEVHLVE